ncbi:MAG: hypothetical protein ACP5SH_07900 [Syntrophobacteraceae bacterium]
MIGSKDAMLELNADQKRNLLSTLGHVDKILHDCLLVLETSAKPSLLPEHFCDFTPQQLARTQERIARFRQEAAELLRRHGLMPERAAKSAGDAVFSYLLFADMALEEIDSNNMDHGKLSNSSAKELDMFVSRMRTLIDNIRACLDNN